ncbi:hypothetical protein VFPPC_15657 [Pochonia chlamydosporia 170]|uniref:Uncharacterized protein n=1 Tax=Pochonia chlamydosporia 170 TaxID=1380566 RepID=A0A179FZS8_METCM|nr:hypothetical protein VFPPC_15657 [Pochonia chlamydosporia 170]OAQ71102.1 hypothetical protein VFPPC_15657 [Pochonia chlamydosporia 170]
MSLACLVNTVHMQHPSNSIEPLNNSSPEAFNVMLCDQVSCSLYCTPSIPDTYLILMYLQPVPGPCCRVRLCFSSFQHGSKNSWNLFILGGVAKWLMEEME